MEDMRWRMATRGSRGRRSWKRICRLLDDFRDIAGDSWIAVAISVWSEVFAGDCGCPDSRCQGRTIRLPIISIK